MGQSGTTLEVGQIWVLREDHHYRPRWMYSGRYLYYGGEKFLVKELPEWPMGVAILWDSLGRPLRLRQGSIERDFDLLPEEP